MYLNLKRETINTICFILICVIIQVFVFVFIVFTNPVSTWRLDQVVILSRHGVRTPLSKNLAKMTPQPWPHWKESPGHLTERGFLLEGYMGKYFSKWLYKEGLLPKSCPTDEEFYVYANSMQRTMASARAFVQNAFPDCNIVIHYSNTSAPDPIFSPFIHNSTAIFKDIALKEMKNVLDGLKLDSSYEIMETILNYNNSDLCQVDNKCNMILDKNKLSVIPGSKPKLSGPLKICNEGIDAFLMAYYNGFPLKDIAWGELDDEKWHSILPLTAAYHNVTYNTTHIANDIAKPLLKYMTNIFLNKTSHVTLLMGHDANINVILNALAFKPFNLQDNFVSTPIGGKIVFQKWFNVELGKYFLKINYVYQSNEQLREGDVLSLKKPPKFALLELNNCEIDKNGFCLWDDFIKVLNSSI